VCEVHIKHAEYVHCADKKLFTSAIYFSLEVVGGKVEL
jgi:hypothetical protein